MRPQAVEIETIHDMKNVHHVISTPVPDIALPLMNDEDASPPDTIQVVIRARHDMAIVTLYLVLLSSSGTSSI